MAELIITEYSKLARDADGNVIAAGEEPSVAVQNRTIGASPVSFSQFNAGTRFVRLHSEAACHVNFAGAAADNMTKLGAGQTEFFGVAVGASLTTSVIQD